MIKRIPKDDGGRFKYWGVLSFRGLYPQTPQEILERHQKRGNMESFIREGKINFDLKNFTRPGGFQSTFECRIIA